tara:strand:+ start:228 stop:329 length:102 start_codon:yes stop_codon:yes gene_type:complete
MRNEKKRDKEKTPHGVVLKNRELRLSKAGGLYV